MKRTTYILSALTALAASTAACNSTDTPSPELDQSVEVTAFQLKANDKVLSHLDSVFFSIDLVNAQIFNADSLPEGTVTSRLIPYITTSGASAVELVVPRPGMTDTIHNYLKNPSDSIDFSNGPVKLRVVSRSGSNERTYTIRVNVHKVKPDSLSWGRAGALPGNLPDVSARRTVNFGGRYYTLSANGQAAQLSEAAAPGATASNRSFNPGFTPDVNSLTAAGDALYILDNKGKLYYTNDINGSWTPTNQTWHAIAASYRNSVAGTRQVQGKWYLTTFPGEISTEMPADFPIEGMSQSVEYSFNMGLRPISLIAGGRTANGQLSNACWGFDGNDWVNISSAYPLPAAVEGAVLLPYYTTHTTADWVTTRYATLLLMGGRLADGQMNRVVYQSPDYGYSWTKAAQSMQLPDDVAFGRGAQGFVVPVTINAAQRIIKPVTEWQCPYIYVYGGKGADGKLQNQLWRGVITRFTFKPIE